jgi:hypothetical protein
MLTGPSPSPVQHRSPAPDSFLARLDPPPTRSLSRALRFSTNTDFFQKSAKPVDSRNAGAPRLRSFSMVPSAKSSSKGKEHGVFDSIESPSYRTFSPPVIATAPLRTCIDLPLPQPTPLHSMT